MSRVSTWKVQVNLPEWRGLGHWSWGLCPESWLGLQAAGHNRGWHCAGRGAQCLTLTNRKEVSVADSVEPTDPSQQHHEDEWRY